MIHELLDVGRENARTGKELAQLLNTDIRHVTAQIERERRDGHAICAETGGQNPGYYIAADENEINDYCESLHRRAAEMYKTRGALLKIKYKNDPAAEAGSS